MSDIVPSDKIEGIVGAPRHPTQHLARAVSAEQQVYILHSAECRDSGIDLRDCPFSVALETRDLLTAHQYETVLALRGWTAAVPA